ncbi:COG4705 family protein [Pseudonocardia sp. DLS-67]
MPEVTIYFWLIKVMCTTVGETAADFLNINLNFGLTGTSVVTGALLVVAMIFQFRADRYVPGTYWLAVALVSVFGTLVTDNLTDNLAVPLEASTVIFGVLLGLTFLAWYHGERTLSIHSIVTSKRETFYWLAILFTFALGTATGDLMAEVLGLGYLVTGIIVVSLIGAITIAWRLGLNSVLAFWIIYVLTRPLGASIGDYLSQPPSQGGLDLGATVTSLIFTVGILGIVTYLAMTKADVTTNTADAPSRAAERGGTWQTAVVVSLIVLAGATGYFWRTSALAAETSDTTSDTTAAQPATAGAQAAPAPHSPLGDLSTFRVITQDTLGLLDSGDQSGATSRIRDLEIEWDNAEARLKPKNKAAWTEIDDKIDTALRELRRTSPDPNSERTALTQLLAAIS